MNAKHPTSNIQHRISNHGAGGRRSAIRCWVLDVGCWMFLFSIFNCPAVSAATNVVTNAEVPVASPAARAETARDFYNAGIEKMRAGNWKEAEPALETALKQREEKIAPKALYDLGYVRFTLGKQELKKSPEGTAKRSRAATEAGAGAVDKAAEALASNDVQQMVEAYVAGRGVRKEMKSATAAVKKAMEAHGKTLAKWRRALSDFQSAAELNPADTNAVKNAEVVAQAIAKLVDSLREMQSAATNMNGKKAELEGLLKQLKGKIPAPNMPPGAPGDDGEEDDDGGEKPKPESLSGKEESDKGGGGQEMGLKLSPEQAGQIMMGIQPDGKQLPMGQGEPGKPKDRSGRTW